MISVLLAYATPQIQVEIPLTVEESCTAALAIQRSGILQRFPEIKLRSTVIGIYGRRVPLDGLLTDGDRIEIYRPLLIDPKQARMARAKKQLTHAR